MRRLVSIALLLLLGWPGFASAWAATQEQRLPACCRRAGAHHCMEMGQPPEQPVVRAVCPVLQRSPDAVQSGTLASGAAIAPTVEMLTEPCSLGQAEAGFRIAAGRAWQKRGPPIQNS